MNLDETTSILIRTPKVLDTLLAGLQSAWLHYDDGPGTWSAYDIVGHLVHADVTNWIPRARMIVGHGTERPFAPFDREAMLGWDREPVAALLARFQTGRLAALDDFAALNLTTADLDRRGLHPDIGEITLGQLLATWVAHDLTHLGQIGEGAGSVTP
jgi:DinB superfamily